MITHHAHRCRACGTERLSNHHATCLACATRPDDAPTPQQCQHCGAAAGGDAVEIMRRGPSGQRYNTTLCGACIEAGCVTGRCSA